MNAKRIGCERFDRTKWIIEQGEAVACIDTGPDEFTVNFLEQRNPLIDSLILVILYGQRHSMLFYDRGGPFEHPPTALH